MSLITSSHDKKKGPSKKKSWYVLYVRSNQETIIQDQINRLELNIIAYSPTQLVVKKWKDRKKKVIKPLLPKIVFVKTDETLRDQVFQINGTINYLFEQKKPAIVRESEIQQLRTITNNNRMISHELTSAVKGSEIDLSPYGFQNVKGIVDKVSNAVCWVTLKTLGCTLKLTLISNKENIK
tara:strand:+ start:210 stop:752 length:543 start_codon:yes stop_codon:yes gene_type:complete